MPVFILKTGPGFAHLLTGVESYDRKLYILVRPYSYMEKHNIKVGDKVYVEGRKAPLTVYETNKVVGAALEGVRGGVYMYVWNTSYVFNPYTREEFQIMRIGE